MKKKIKRDFKKYYMPLSNIIALKTEKLFSDYNYFLSYYPIIEHSVFFYFTLSHNLIWGKKYKCNKQIASKRLSLINYNIQVSSIKNYRIINVREKIYIITNKWPVKI